ncbi:MAG TPA: MBL fold metallo-hydrolase [Gammaproteobacteria bacterium]|nr:MBL fold metallo-hydrolase [Gammaproteobacteria bacterium]
MTANPPRMLTTRRTLIKGAVALATARVTAQLYAQPPAANRSPPPPGTRLVMLGTRGGPGVSVDRSESASAVVVDGVPYLVDCGYGTMRALVAAGIGYQTVSTMFLTHLHDDHTADIAALLSHQWTGSKTTPTNVYGPYATERTVKGAIEFFRANVEIRTVDEGRKGKPEEMFFGHDVDVGNDPVRVFADDKVVVTSATNTHFPERFVARMQHRSLGYRFETSTRSICFSGDTAYSANIVKLARGADVFVCEVMDHRTWENNMARAKEQAAAGNTESVARHVAETHSTPGDVGRMAKEAGVKTVVLNHQLRGQAAQGWTIASFIDLVRAEFDGNVIVGEDQLVI